MSNEQHASTAPDIDALALDVARRFTEEWDPQRRASLQVSIIQAIRTALAQCIDLGQRQDAARWRWVREQSGVTVSVEEADDDGDLAFVSGHTPEELDAAIDGQRNAGAGVGA